MEVHPDVEREKGPSAGLLREADWEFVLKFAVRQTASCPRFVDPECFETAATAAVHLDVEREKGPLAGLLREAGRELV